MKKLLPILILIFVGCSSPEPTNYQMLIQQDGIYYLKDSDNIFTGPVFNINGKSEGYIKDGKRQGTFKYYHKNGQLRIEEKYRNGKEEGSYKIYYSNGNLLKEGTYKDGKSNGPYKSYHLNGELKEKGILMVTMMVHICLTSKMDN